MATINLTADIEEYSDNIVANLEVVIPAEYNTADSVNGTIIPAITSSGLWIIGNEVNWSKDTNGNNVLRIFGATEGRVNPATSKELATRLQNALPF